jgi:hypothetical protein
MPQATRQEQSGQYGQSFDTGRLGVLGVAKGDFCRKKGEDN